MRVRCLTSEFTGSGYPNDSEHFRISEGRLGVTPGEEHRVYALHLTSDGVWYEIEDEADHLPSDVGYLFALPAPIFEIIERSLPRFWGITPREWGLYVGPEAIARKDFHKDLIRGRSSAVEQFRECKRRTRRAEMVGPRSCLPSLDDVLAEIPGESEVTGGDWLGDIASRKEPDPGTFARLLNEGLNED